MTGTGGPEGEDMSPSGKREESPLRRRSQRLAGNTNPNNGGRSQGPRATSTDGPSEPHRAGTAGAAEEGRPGDSIAQAGGGSGEGEALQQEADSAGAAGAAELESHRNDAGAPGGAPPAEADQGPEEAGGEESTSLLGDSGAAAGAARAGGGGVSTGDVALVEPIGLTSDNDSDDEDATTAIQRLRRELRGTLLRQQSHLATHEQGLDQLSTRLWELEQGQQEWEQWRQDTAPVVQSLVQADVVTTVPVIAREAENLAVAAAQIREDIEGLHKVQQADQEYLKRRIAKLDQAVGGESGPGRPQAPASDRAGAASRSTASRAPGVGPAGAESLLVTQGALEDALSEVEGKVQRGLTDHLRVAVAARVDSRAEEVTEQLTATIKASATQQDQAIAAIKASATQQGQAIALLQEDMERVQSVLFLDEGGHDAQIQETQAAIASLEGLGESVLMANTELARLARQELEGQRTRLTALQAAQAGPRVSRMDTRLDELHQTMTQLAERDDEPTLHADIQGLRAELQAATGSTEALTASIDETSGSINELEDKIASLQRGLGGRVTELQQQVDVVTGRTAEPRGDNAQLLDRMGHLEQRVQEAEALLHRREEEGKALWDRLQRVEVRLDLSQPSVQGGVHDHAAGMSARRGGLTSPGARLSGERPRGPTASPGGRVSWAADSPSASRGTTGDGAYRAGSAAGLSSSDGDAALYERLYDRLLKITPKLADITMGSAPGLTVQTEYGPRATGVDFEASFWMELDDNTERLSQAQQVRLARALMDSEHCPTGLQLVQAQLRSNTPSITLLMSDMHAYWTDDAPQATRQRLQNIKFTGPGSTPDKMFFTSFKVALAAAQSYDVCTAPRDVLGQLKLALGAKAQQWLDDRLDHITATVVTNGQDIERWIETPANLQEFWRRLIQKAAVPETAGGAAPRHPAAPSRQATGQPGAGAGGTGRAQLRQIHSQREEDSADSDTAVLMRELRLARAAQQDAECRLAYSQVFTTLQERMGTAAPAMTTVLDRLGGHKRPDTVTGRLQATTAVQCPACGQPPHVQEAERQNIPSSEAWRACPWFLHPEKARGGADREATAARAQAAIRTDNGERESEVSALDLEDASGN
jgi:hypothetical protein